MWLNFFCSDQYCFLKCLKISSQVMHWLYLLPNLRCDLTTCFDFVLFQDEETCRIVVTQDLSSRPPTAILLANVPEPLSLAAAEESPAVRDAVEMLPSLTAPPPPSPQTTTVVVTSQPPPEISIPLSTATVIERTLPQELTESNMSGR